jgi:hypothetical protein
MTSQALNVSRSHLPPYAVLVVFGPLFALAFSRWGSYIGYPAANVFVPDLLIALGSLSFLMDAVGKRTTFRMRPRGTASGWALCALLTYAVLWVSAATAPPASILRDTVPFGYLAATPLMARVLIAVGIERSVAWLRTACWLHLAWGLPAALGLLHPTAVLPVTVAGQPFFELRDDVDAAIFVTSIVIGAIGLGRRAERRLPDVLLIVGSTIAIVLQSSRTGLAGLAVSGVVAVLVFKPWRQAALRFSGRLLGVALVGVAALAYVSFFPDMLPQGGVFARIGLGSGDQAAELAQGASNTASARWQAWELLISHTNQLNLGWLVGAGPGSEVVADSGALVHLSGDPSVRAPHSWPVGLYARFGAIGVALWTLCVILLARRTYTGESAGTQSEDLLRGATAMWFALAAGLATAATVGVVFESPFGALPFSLACAGISASRTESARVHSDRTSTLSP